MTRPTCSEPNVPSRAAVSSSGVPPSAMSWVSRAPRRNGLPPVTAWHAWANPALASGRRSRTSVSVATGPEGARPHGRLGCTGQQLLQQFGCRGRLARPHRAEHADPQLAERVRQQRQPAQRRRVGPVNVVDDEHSGVALAEVAGQPDESARGSVHRLARRRRLARLGCERALGQARCADRQLLPLRASSQRLEQLARRTPGGVLLERAAACVQHGRALCPRDPPGSREQGRLADPRGPLDEDDASGAGSSLRQPPTQLGQFGVSVQQDTHCHCRDATPDGGRAPASREKIVEGPTMRARSSAATITVMTTDRTGTATIAADAGRPQDGYSLARTPEEYERLRAQARVWESTTGRLLDRVALAAGSRCLDAGCGPGETMRLMAQRVGPSGRVVGVDVDERLGRQALAALHDAGHRQCEFAHVDLTTR